MIMENEDLKKEEKNVEDIEFTESNDGLGEPFIGNDV